MIPIRLAAICAVLSVAMPAVAQEAGCTATTQCQWSLLDEFSGHDYDMMNAEIMQGVAAARIAITDHDRDDLKLDVLLERITSLCASAKCKAQKSLCAEAHQLAGLHGYLKQSYVPKLANLDDLAFAPLSEMFAAAQ